MGNNPKLEVEGKLKVIDTTGRWGEYEGEQVIVGPGYSFHDDLGIKIREMFEPGARESMASGALPVSFSLPRVRITVEVLDPAVRPGDTSSASDA